MTLEEFKNLLSQDESSILDFKKNHYNLIPKDEYEESKFIKDIISFTNTIREQTSHIIIGVEDSNGTKILHGLDKNYDDALLQDKIKDKVNPKPNFRYYSFQYDEKRFGIFEFPLTRYDGPITPITKMRGLEIGKVYTRRGSTNSEATHLEAIIINNWITTIIPNHDKNQIRKSINILIHDIQANEYYSPFLSNSLEIANQINDASLKEFCEYELIGWEKNPTRQNWNHRDINCFSSFLRIREARFPKGTSLSTMWNELRQNKDFWEAQIFLGDAVSHLETQLKDHRKGPGNQFTILPKKASELLNNKKYEKKDYDLFIYWGEDNLTLTYSRSKQKLIELLTLCLSKCT